MGSRRIDPVWDTLQPAGWTAFARAWLGDLRGDPGDLGRPWPAHACGVPLEKVGLAVVAMNFSARPERQWSFIAAALSQADSEQELEHLAAGPLEHILGSHGESWIDRIEREAAQDPRLARALTGVHQYRMTDAVWSRVQAIQARVDRPLGRDP